MSRPAAAGAPVLLVVVKGYPRISETFVAQELAALERRGLRLAVASLRRPYDPLVHPVHRMVRAPVLYLPEHLREAPARVAGSHLRLLARAPRSYVRGLACWIRDLLRDPTPNRVRRFGQAGVLAAELPAGTRHIHAHFLHTPASVARYAALMTGLSYSLSAHAKDVWTTPAWELRDKLADARFCVVCSRASREHLTGLAPGAPIHLVYHGLDRALFAPPETPRPGRDGRDPTDPARLLSVARFHPKKGLDLVLQAFAALRAHATLTLVGYGPAESELRALCDALGVAGRVRWTGPLDQPAVLALYRESDLFVLAPRIAPDGDRDGLPNVAVEALSQGLPVVATGVAGLPELIEDGESGRLVPPENPAALARALAELIGDPVARRRLGAAGIRRVARGFDVDDGAARLHALLDPLLGGAAAASEAVCPAMQAGARRTP